MICRNHNSLLVLILMVSMLLLKGCANASDDMASTGINTNKTIADSFKETMDKVELRDRHIRIGNKLMREGKYQDAIREMMMLESYGGMYWRLAQYKIASCYSSLGQHNRALEFFQLWYDSCADWAKEKYKDEYNQYRHKVGLPLID